MSRYLPVAHVDPPARVHPERFKSKSMIDYVRLHEILPQFLIHSGLRFQLHLRLLRRAVETLRAEFQRLYQAGERSEVSPQELWGRLDPYFHDLDLLTIQTLLALRAFFPGLSKAELRKFGVELHCQVPWFALSDQTTESKGLSH